MAKQNARDVKEAMIEIYGDNCWMGYQVTRKNPFTYHHIKEARNGGKVTIDNGAILSHYAHEDLNTMEAIKPAYYRELNLMFEELNDTRRPPTKEYYAEIKKILLSASKYIRLSGNFIPNAYPFEDDDVYELVNEEDLYIPKRYQNDERIYNTSEGHKPMYIPEIIIPNDYKVKVKKKNRNNRIYTFE